MLIVGNEVWLPGGGAVYRHDFTGNYLGSYPISIGAGTIVVPEPTASLAICGLMLLASKRLRRPSRN
jgi:hypothetical protein